MNSGKKEFVFFGEWSTYLQFEKKNTVGERKVLIKLINTIIKLGFRTGYLKNEKKSIDQKINNKKKLELI